MCVCVSSVDASYASHNGIGPIGMGAATGTTTSSSSMGGMFSSTAADLAQLSLNLSTQSSLQHQQQQQQQMRSSTSSHHLLSAPGMSSSSLPPLSPLSLPALPLDAMTALGTVPLQSFRHPEPESIADMLEIPGKGRCYVYLAKYTYEPFNQSPNDNPEAEVSLTAGDYVLVWGNMDEVLII